MYSGRLLDALLRPGLQGGLREGKRLFCLRYVRNFSSDKTQPLDGQYLTENTVGFQKPNLEKWAQDPGSFELSEGHVEVSVGSGAGS